jgi:hypothetical protein
MTDDLLEALTSAPPKDSRKTCYYRNWHESQSPEVQAALTGAMNNPKWSSAAIYRLVQERGYEKQYNTLRVHRSGECSCDE